MSIDITGVTDLPPRLCSLAVHFRSGQCVPRGKCGIRRPPSFSGQAGVGKANLRPTAFVISTERQRRFNRAGPLERDPGIRPETRPGYRSNARRRWGLHMAVTYRPAIQHQVKERMAETPRVQFVTTKKGGIRVDAALALI